MGINKKWIKQLTDHTFIKKVDMRNFNLEIHIVSNYESPDVIKEINRISALAFGLKKYGDEFDKMYKYICVYHPANQEISGFYRYIVCQKAISAPNFHTSVRLATAKFYNLSKDFLDYVAPYTIDFGRFVVNENSYFEKTTGQTLRVLWMCLAIFVEEYYNKKQPNGKDPIIKYFFGKFSLQKRLYREESIDMIFNFFRKYYSVSEKMLNYVTPKKEFDVKLVDDVDYFEGLSEKQAKKRLGNFLTEREEKLPQLAFHYVSLLSMKVWNPVWNVGLDSWKMAMIIDVSKISDLVLSEFMGDYKSKNHPVFKDI